MRALRTTLLSLSFAALVAATAACETAEPVAGTTTTTATTAPASAAPAASPSAEDNTEEVCTTVTKVLIDGSVKIADDSVKSIEKGWSARQQNENLQKNFAAIGKKVTAEADKATDPELKKTIEEAGAEVAAGAKKSDALAYLKKDFQKVAQNIDKECGN
jgi:hypothetical protein